MKCPICSERLYVKSGNSGYEMFVAEDDGSCVEAYDVDIKMYRCSNGHTVYISKVVYHGAP